MFTLLFSAIFNIRSWFQSRAALQVEILALRHQLTVLKRSQRGRLRLNSADRLLWVGLSRLWSQWRSALLIVKPETVIAWHRRAFRWYWRWKSRQGEPGRPAIDGEVRELIRKMSLGNPLWGAPRIHGELLKLGIEVSQATVAKHMVRQRRPPSQTWRTFLNTHAKQLVSTDFFVVPTVTFRVLYVFVGRTRGGASSISTSPPTPARNGQHNRWSRRFLGIMCPVISCGIAMPFMGSRSAPGSGGWASAKCSPRHSLRGKTRTPSASSAPFDASAWTT